MKAFFKDVLRRMAVLLVSATLFTVLSLIIFSFFAGSFLSPPSERIKKDSFLVLDLTMNLTDRPADVIGLGRRPDELFMDRRQARIDSKCILQLLSP